MNVLANFVGELLEIWTGSYIKAGENIGILAVIVKGGYYSITKYSWTYNGEMEEKEKYPILYATKKGSYCCIVEVNYLTFSFCFTIQGKTWSYLPKLIINLMYCILKGMIIGPLKHHKASQQLYLG